MHRKKYFFVPLLTGTNFFLLSVNMVPRWNKLSLRVFTTVPRRSSEEAMEAQSVVVQRMLQLLRIRAKSIVIQVHEEKNTRVFF